MSLETADLLSELYKLRSHQGVIRAQAEREHDLATVSRMATMQEETTERIEAIERREAAQSVIQSH